MLLKTELPPHKDKTPFPNDTDQHRVTFFKAYSPAPEIVPADKTACGTLPTAAFQYCEAIRQASALGWHIYPPKDIHLLFDGHETFYHEDDQWYPVKSAAFENDFCEHWNRMAPPELADCAPPYLSEIFVPGIIQIWSGYMVASQPGTNLLIRPLANCGSRSSYSCFEGLVKSDRFCPMPLFINIKLNATNREIYIPSYKPLFQVTAMPENIVTLNTNASQTQELNEEMAREFDWDGFSGTIRMSSERDHHRPGRYAKMARKTEKSGIV